MGRNLRQYNWDNKPTVDPGDFVPMPAGGYVCKILDANFGKSKASGNEMLILKIDVAEGDFTNNFTNTVARFNQENWPNAATYRQMLFDKQGDADSRFKGLIRILQECNPGFVANIDDFDEKVLVGKMCGFVFGDEEYPKQDGSIGIRAAVRTPKILDDIRKGNFKIPPLKKLDADKSPTYQRTNQYSKPPESPDPPSPVGEVIDLEDPPF